MVQYHYHLKSQKMRALAGAIEHLEDRKAEGIELYNNNSVIEL